ncbi:MAG: tRNA uridine(34) 5-carboxymethylaminomethyl modification radical SAM/GNAT enzyme Elp3, partial [Thermoplasmata archaeon]
MEPLAELANRVLAGELKDEEDLRRAKLEICRERGLMGVPSNQQILRHVPEEWRDRLALLRKKPVRTASGVAVVAVMTSPAHCPHGKCIYCPGGVEWGSPQAYTGSEPAAMRAAQHGYDPRGQTESRLRQLHEIGHPTDKVDLIIIGGTFTSRPEAYREAFVKGCFDALNGRGSTSLEAAQRINETAKHRCIGLTMETKPDCFLGGEVDHSLRLGVTRVELGVQSLHENVLELVNRGHGLREVVEATNRAKDAGLKVGFHMMPGLPGSSYERDLDSFRELFDNPSYRPDMLKVYPVLVIEGTGLHGLWLRGQYKEMETEEAAGLLAEAKRYVPPYVRISRIQREIPAREIEAGVKK